MIFRAWPQKVVSFYSNFSSASNLKGCSERFGMDNI